MSNVDGTVGGILAGMGCLILLAKLAFYGMIAYGIYYFIFYVMPAWAA